MGVIYARPNLINGKKYVGQAKDLKKRQRDWNNLNQPYAGEAINSARAKYGLDAFDFEILKECEDDELNYWEKYYIKELNTKAPYGYNLTDGGDGVNGYSPSEETRKKMSDAQKGKHLTEEAKRKIGEAKKGKHHTEEAKHKMSEAHKGENNPLYGKHLSEETKRKISEAKKGENNPLYGKHLSEEHKRKMSDAKKGENNPFYGKHHTEEAKRKLSEAHKGKPNVKLSKPVLQINKTTGEVIREWPSTIEVQRQLGYSNQNISQCCLGKRPFAYNYKWQYAV